MIELFYLMGLEQILPIRVRGDLRIMAMNGYPTFPKASKIEPHHQMQFCVIPRTLIGGVLHLFRATFNVFYWPC